jgi:hypothetical protein
MGRYLQGTLSAEKARSVERHLHHCPRCSSAIIDYIQAEEPQHYKQYAKKLKGILKTGEATKKSVVSPFQMKAIRTATAVVALLIFSFFALKTVINKQADYSLPSESLATVKKSEPVAPVRHRPAKKIEKSAETKEEAKNVTKVTKKKVKASQPAITANEARPVVTKARTKPQLGSSNKIKPVQKEESIKETAPPANTTALKTPASPVVEPAVAANVAATAEPPVNETASRKPLPTLEKIEATKEAEEIAPVGHSQPAEMPLPRNQIRER